MRKAEGSWADAYRNKWKWDRVAWGSHNVDCYPSGCPLHVYVKDAGSHRSPCARGRGEVLSRRGSAQRIDASRQAWPRMRSASAVALRAASA